jgi:hypothetical protein
MTEEKWQKFFTGLRAMAFEFIALMEDLLSYPKEDRTSALLKDARRRR